MDTNRFHRGKYVNHSDSAIPPARAFSDCLVVVVVVVVTVAVVASVAASRSSLGFVNEIHALRFSGVRNNASADAIMRAGIGVVGYRSREADSGDASRGTQDVADVACDMQVRHVNGC